MEKVLRIKGKKLLMVAGGTLLIGMIPAMSAFESHLLNVTTRVVQADLPIAKTFAATLSDTVEVDADADGDFEPATSGDFSLANAPEAAFAAGPAGLDHTIAAAGVQACWEFDLTVTNTFAYEMRGATVIDRFGARRLADGLALADAVDVYNVALTRGKSKKSPVTPDSFTKLITLTWYPGLDPGEPGPDDPGFDPFLSELASGETQTMVATVCTKENPGFQQELAGPGVYEMNSGATIKRTNPQNHRFSAQTGPVNVEAVEITSIDVTPAGPSLSVGGSQQLAASGTGSQGSIFDLTRVAEWSSSAPGVATVDDEGLVTGQSAGPANISATHGSAVGGTAVTVN